MIYSNPLPLPEYPVNLATMLDELHKKLPDHIVYQERVGKLYSPTTWRTFYRDICCLQSGLITRGLKPGDRVAILSKNSIEYAIMFF
ncbi:MAG: AMP-binding protein, partial [Fidelibacterota bacterium]